MSTANEKSKGRITRRSFLKSSGGALALTSLSAGSLIGFTSQVQGATGDPPGRGKVVGKRALGKTGEQVSIVGFGGVVVSAVDQLRADALVREAIDRGVNYFDVSPAYGNAERRLGPALREFRKNVFLTCKTKKRDKVGAAAELRKSLKTLQTDYFDLYELHAIDEHMEEAVGSGGAIEALVEAREKGLIRHIGFSVHNENVALAAMDRFDFDSIMFPVNWVCYSNSNFGSRVVARAKEKGMGLVAIKAMARRPWRKDEDRKELSKYWYRPVTDPEEAALAVRFALSEPVTAVIPSGDIRFLRRALDIADAFQPLTDTDREALKKRAAGIKPMFG